MAVGNIVGVEPLPNGGYNFVDKAGAKKTLFGPAADELVQRFKASEALTGPQPTAMNDGAGGTTASDLVVPEGGFGGFGGQVPQPKIATDVPTPVPGAEGPPASIAAPAPQHPGPRALYAGSKPGETIIQNPDGTVMVETRSAPTRGGPQEKSRTVKGGFDPSEGYIDATVGAFKEQQAGEELGAAMASQQAAEERGFLEEQQRQLVAQQQQQQQQMETIKRGVAEKQAAYDIAQSKYNNFSEIDQDRIWRKKGTGASILAVIGASLGAFGSALTKTPNFALEIINSAIDRDLRSQEQEIAINREAAGNALADLQRQTGSLDLAKTALGALQTQRVQMQIQAMANKAKTPAAIASFQKANGMLMQAYADKLEEYRQKATGEVTKSIVNVPGSAGGTTLRLGTVAEAQSLKNLHKSDAPRKDPGAVKEERELAVQSERLNAYEDRLARYPEDAVPKVYENRSAIGKAYEATRDWAVGAGSTQRGLDDEERELVQDFNQVKTDLTGAIAKGAGTGTLSDGDRAAIESGLAPGATVGMMRRAIAAAREVNLRSQQVIKKFGPVPAQEIPTRPVE
jgi:hypothetical protein